MKKLTIRKIFDAAVAASIATVCVAVLFWSTPVHAVGDTPAKLFNTKETCSLYAQQIHDDFHEFNNDNNLSREDVLRELEKQKDKNSSDENKVQDILAPVLMDVFFNARNKKHAKRIFEKGCIQAFKQLFGLQ